MAELPPGPPPRALASGPYGRAVLVDLTEAAPAGRACLRAYVVTAPNWHPFWDQYVVSVISLAGYPGIKPAVKLTPEMTHEIHCLTMNPEGGPYGADPRNPAWRSLTPVNVGEQIATTDEVACWVLDHLVWAVLQGILQPEGSNGYERIRATWVQYIAGTLNHLKDPAHGRLN